MLPCAGTRALSGFSSFGDNNTDDCYGHGTHVSGIAGGLTFGVAKNVTLYAGKPGIRMTSNTLPAGKPASARVARQCGAWRATVRGPPRRCLRAWTGWQPTGCVRQWPACPWARAPPSPCWTPLRAPSSASASPSSPQPETTTTVRLGVAPAACPGQTAGGACTVQRACRCVPDQPGAGAAGNHGGGVRLVGHAVALQQLWQLRGPVRAWREHPQLGVLHDHSQPDCLWHFHGLPARLRRGRAVSAGQPGRATGRGRSPCSDP